MAAIVALGFLAIVGASVIITGLPAVVLMVYLGTSAVTFVVYAFDKSAARRGAWRISESTLHLLALAGGWPGALVAQQTLRHKTSKRPFRVTFWATVVLNCSTLAWMHTADGYRWVESLLGAKITSWTP